MGLDTIVQLLDLVPIGMILLLLTATQDLQLLVLPLTKSEEATNCSLPH